MLAITNTNCTQTQIDLKVTSIHFFFKIKNELHIIIQQNNILFHRNFKSIRF